MTRVYRIWKFGLKEVAIQGLASSATVSGSTIGQYI
jgi:hypothetical protein